MVRAVQLVQDGLDISVGTVGVQDQDIFLADAGNLKNNCLIV